MVDFHYKKYGDGKKALVFFHGFGEDHQVFNPLISQFLIVEKNIRCYSIDIYYHGKSDRKEKLLTKDEWRLKFGKFLEKEDIKSFSLVGFSLGGRFAISTAIAFSRQVQSLFLLAPDGIFQSFWYRLANTSIGNMIFKYLMKKPKSFNQLVNFYSFTHLAPKTIIRFVRKTLVSNEERLRVYKSWTYFHDLQYASREISQTVNDYKIPVFLILGEKDNIIPAKKILPKMNQITTLNHIIIPAKHHQIIQESSDYIITRYKDLKL